ncbi:MAG: peptidase T [Tissierellia bacterium]|nr:peptidase T [Tissierellia bacterium]
MNIEEKVVERLIRYAKVYTTSDPESESVPSTARQMDLAKLLKQEMEEMGLSVTLTDQCYLYSKVPANKDGLPAIGLVAHMDTAPDLTGENVNPQIHENYDGGDIDLAGDGTYILSPKDFPELKEKVGKTLITTDGTTLLGSDDKSGIAEILTAVEYLLAHPEIEHGDICIGFTPDEEIGRGADFFDVEGFGADFAYTIDGGAIGEIEYENFNAAGAKITIKGRNVHPGSAKLKMKNALIYAFELFSMLPVFDRPEHTEGREGFIHLNDLNGNVEEAEMIFIIRDHDREKFEAKKELLKATCEFMRKKHQIEIDLDMSDSYYNMREVIEKDMAPVDLAVKAMESVGVEPKISIIRGGTDGAQISYKGLPCPNLFTGGYNFHGRYEYAVIEEMTKAVETIIAILRR